MLRLIWAVAFCLIPSYAESAVCSVRRHRLVARARAWLSVDPRSHALGTTPIHFRGGADGHSDIVDNDDDPDEEDEDEDENEDEDEDEDDEAEDPSDDDDNDDGEDDDDEDEDEEGGNDLAEAVPEESIVKQLLARGVMMAVLMAVQARMKTKQDQHMAALNAEKEAAKENSDAEVASPEKSFAEEAREWIDASLSVGAPPEKSFAE